MNKVIFLATVACLMTMVVPSAHAHTLAETNAVVKAALDYLQQAYPDNWGTNNFIEVAADEIPDTWEYFLGGDETNGWTHAEKRAAFDWYLSSLGSTDCRSLPSDGQWRVKAAIAQCDTLNHTNAWPFLKALSLNPRGIHRDRAIQLAIRFGPVDDAMTDFVETIGTNVASYGYAERGTYCAYQKRLAAISTTNALECAVRDRAVRRFYQHRFGPSVAGAVSRDFLFRDYLAGYAQSSNRLEFACYVLGTQEGRVNDEEYFISVTNQLLSAGTPLRQLGFEGKAD
ncbi:MAG: hypothetical protein MJ249_09765 [Kiritimatiellae bacterium]|nr:hypothetical protein [Kiritimatiellia bacterium]